MVISDTCTSVISPAGDSDRRSQPRSARSCRHPPAKPALAEKCRLVPPVTPVSGTPKGLLLEDLKCLLESFIPKIFWHTHTGICTSQICDAYPFTTLKAGYRLGFVAALYIHIILIVFTGVNAFLGTGQAPSCCL